MAEGIVSEIVGDGDDEESGVASPEIPAGAEAFASAIAARLSHNDPEVCRKTAAYLADQSALVKTQKKHLELEQELRLASLRNHVREQGLRRFGMRLRTAFQLFLALLGGALGLGC